MERTKRNISELLNFIVTISQVTCSSPRCIGNVLRISYLLISKAKVKMTIMKKISINGKHYFICGVRTFLYSIYPFLPFFKFLSTTGTTKTLMFDLVVVLDISMCN